MRLRHSPYARLLGICLVLGMVSTLAAQQSVPSTSAARTLLLPKRVVSGETATLAVLDVTGRLTPGVTVKFSNGDHVVTNATGRALFVAPSNAGVIYATIASRPKRVYTTVLTAAEVSSNAIQITSVPAFASLADRFELMGSGLCGAADANVVRVAGQLALVVASSPATLIVLPPENLQPGPATMEVSCSKRSARPISITFLALSLHADSAPLAPGEHRTFAVQVEGTTAKVLLEAHNLSPDVADLAGGATASVLSSGGVENKAEFAVFGRKGGKFAISVRLVPIPLALQPKR